MSEIERKLLLNNDTIEKITQIVSGEPIEERTLSVLKLNNVDLSTLMSFITGHSASHVHLNRVGVVENYECRTWSAEIETMERFLFHWQARDPNILVMILHQIQYVSDV